MPAVTDLVQRESALEALDVALCSGAAGRGSLVVFRGPAGVGLSTLLDVAGDLAQQRGFTVRRVSASAQERDLAFGVVDQLASAPGPVDADALGRAQAVLDQARGADVAPLLITLDDLQLADAQSATALGFVARRLSALPLVVVAAVHGPARELEEDLRPATVLEIAALDTDGVTRLLDAPTPDAAAACHALTRGNPMLLSMLARDGSGATALPAVARWALARAADAGGRATATVRLLAVLGPAADADLIARLVGGEPDDPSAGVLRQAGLLHAERLELAHPLVANSVAAEVEPAERNAVLLAAAADALGRGHPDTARAFAARALEAPPPSPARAATLHVLGTARFLSGDPAGVEDLQGALAASTDPEQRATIAADLASVLCLYDRVPEALDVTDGLADALDPLDPVGRHLEAVRVHCAAFDIATTELVCARMSVEEELLGNLDREDRLLTAVAAYLQAKRGRSAALTAELARKAAAEHQLIEDFSIGILAMMYTAQSLLVSDAFADAEALIGAMVARAQERSSTMLLNGASWLRGCLHLRRGAVDDAVRDLQAAVDLSRGLHTTTDINAAVLAEALLVRGEVAAARAALDTAAAAGQLDADESTSVFALFVLHARARVALAEDDLDCAITGFLTLGARLRRWGDHNPAQFPWRSGLAEALDRTGDTAEASRLAHEELELAERFGAPRAISIAARVAGAIDRSPELLQRAVEVTDGTCLALTRAEALCAQGAAMRRARQRVAARPPLREAEALAAACGASPLRELAAAELAATGAATSRHAADDLTASERRVCDLAARGMSNPAIARELHVSRATVESHLHSAYRKLGIRTRGELLLALGADS